MALALIAEATALALAVALVAMGAVAAMMASSVGKRLIGIVVAQTGGVFILVLMGMSAAALVGVGLLLAYIALAAGVIVSLQEAYGASETIDIDRADDADLPTEHGG
jgi:hypothetical protein